MIHIYIDKINREVTLKNNKQKLIKKYSNISTKGNSDFLINIKLCIYAINKIFNLNVRYNDDEYIFYVNDEDFINYVKDENYFYEKVNSKWKEELGIKTYSELGNFLKLFKRISYKDVRYWERDESYNLADEKEKLYLEQSKCDTLIQDILHSIRELKINEINADNAIEYVKELNKIGQERLSIKKKIKLIEKKERIINEQKEETKQ